MGKLIKTSSIAAILFMFGCASQPFPYFDGASNDPNRAPSSLGIPETVDVVTLSKDKIDSQSAADALYLEAEIASQQGQSKKAIESFEQVAKADPKAAYPLYRLANENFRIGQIKTAVTWIEKALQIKPDDKDINILAGGLYSTNGEFAKAEKAYKKCIQLYKDEPEAYLYLAALYAEQKKYPQALAHFKKLESFDDFAQKHLVYYYRARTMLEQKNKNISAVKKDLNTSLKYKPDFLEALQMLGKIIESEKGKLAVFKFYADYQRTHEPIPQVAEVLSQYYLQIGDYDKAYEQLEIVEGATTDQVPVKLKMALILIDKKMYDKAYTRLQELLTLAPESDKVRYYLGAVAEELKKVDEAVAYYKEMPSDSGMYDESLNRLAFIYKNQGKYLDSIKTLKKLVEKKPKSVMSYLALSQVYEESGDVTAAIATLTKVESQFSKESQLHYSLGVLYDKKNDKKKMLSSMKKAIETDPNNAVAHNYYAYSLLDMGQELELAEKHAIIAHQLDKNDPFILDTIGWLYYTKGDFKKSMQYLEKAYLLMPEVPIIIDHLADVYAKLNMRSKAYSLYQKALNFETDETRKKQLMVKIAETSIAQNRKPSSVSDKPAKLKSGLNALEPDEAE